MILPSHHRLVDREAIAHYGNILGQLSRTVQAGTVALTRYGIWHKAGPKLNATRRGMIKFSYYRNTLPKRDWITASAAASAYHHPERHPYVTVVESYRDRRRCEQTWSCSAGRFPWRNRCRRHTASTPAFLSSNVRGVPES